MNRNRVYNDIPNIILTKCILQLFLIKVKLKFTMIRNVGYQMQSTKNYSVQDEIELIPI